MKLRNNYFYTLRENVRDEDSTSSELLVRSGMKKEFFWCLYVFTN
jgi:prolyl-tRNA synthetase